MYPDNVLDKEIEDFLSQYDGDRRTQNQLLKNFIRAGFSFAQRNDPIDLASLLLLDEASIHLLLRSANTFVVDNNVVTHSKIEPALKPSARQSTVPASQPITIKETKGKMKTLPLTPTRPNTVIDQPKKTANFDDVDEEDTDPLTMLSKMAIQSN